MQKARCTTKIYDFVCKNNFTKDSAVKIDNSLTSMDVSSADCKTYVYDIDEKRNVVSEKVLIVASIRKEFTFYRAMSRS